MPSIKGGDMVWLTEFAQSKNGLGSRDYVPNSFTKKLLQGHAVEVYDTVPVVHGSADLSVRFEGGSYSLSAKYFELATAEKRKIPFSIRLERLWWDLLDFLHI